VSQIDHHYLTRISANLADDSSIMTRLHLATIIWHGVEREVIVLAGRRPLMGTALIEDYHLSVDFCEGGSVIIDEIM